MRYLNDLMLNGANIATSPASAAVDTSYVLQVSMQAQFTGTAPTGTIKLQCSNDDLATVNLNGGVPVNWTDIPNSSVAVTTTGTYLMPKLDICYQYIRAKWAHTSGTGTVTASIKTVGA